MKFPTCCRYYLLLMEIRCINAESAYKAIHWPSIILIDRDDAFCAGAAKNRRRGFSGSRDLMDVCRRQGPYLMLGYPVCDVQPLACLFRL